MELNGTNKLPVTFVAVKTFECYSWYSLYLEFKYEYASHVSILSSEKAKSLLRPLMDSLRLMNIFLPSVTDHGCFSVSPDEWRDGKLPQMRVWKPNLLHPFPGRLLVKSIGHTSLTSPEKEINNLFTSLLEDGTF